MRERPLIRVGGICGETAQEVSEAQLLQLLGYHLGLLNLGALRLANEQQLIAHCRRVAEVLPVFGFYLNRDAGGRELPYSFWRSFTEIENALSEKALAIGTH